MKGATFWNYGDGSPLSPGSTCNLALTCSDPLSVHRKKSLRKKYQWLGILKEKVLTKKRLVHRNCKCEKELGQTNRVTDVENKLTVTKVGSTGWDGLGDWERIK